MLNKEEKQEKKIVNSLKEWGKTHFFIKDRSYARLSYDEVYILLNLITKLQKENEEKDKEILNLKNEINKAWEEWNDLEQGSYEEEIRLKEEIKKKDKQIDLMGLAILNYDDQLVINRYKDIDEVKETFKDLAKEKRE